MWMLNNNYRPVLIHMSPHYLLYCSSLFFSPSLPPSPSSLPSLPLSPADSRDRAFTPGTAQAIIWSSGPVGSIDNDVTGTTIPVPFQHYENMRPRRGGASFSFLSPVIFLSHTIIIIYSCTLILHLAKSSNLASKIKIHILILRLQQKYFPQDYHNLP